MEFFHKKTNFDFVGHIKPLISISGSLVLASILLVAFKGLNYGIEFAGGTEALISFTQPTNLDEVRVVCNGIGLDQPELVRYGLGDEGRYLVRSRTRSLLTPAEVEKVKSSVTAKLGQPVIWDATDEAGEQIRVKFDKPVTKEELAGAAQESGLPGIDVGIQSQSANPIYLLHMPSIRARLSAGLKAKFADTFKDIDRLESVGSAVGAQMRNQGALSLIYAMLGIVLYIAFRFDMRFAPGAIVALVHDVTITTGVFSLFGMEFNLQIIAALLAIMGYSVNDTVVVYDRIRETMGKVSGKPMSEIINRSVNDTLSRTIMTSSVTQVAVLATLFFGGDVTRGFAIAMTIGIVVGTASSIIIAAPVTMFLDRYFQTKDKGKGAADKGRIDANTARP